MKVIKTQRNSKYCLICGMENPLGLKAPFYELEDGSLATIVKFKSEHQSYPDRTHGGMVSALLDELIGRVLWINEPKTFGVTTTLTVTYRNAVPPNTAVKARAVITFNGSRGFSGKGEIYTLDGKLLAQAQAKYFKIPLEKAFDENASFHQEMCYEMPLDVTELDFPELR